VSRRAPTFAARVLRPLLRVAARLGVAREALDLDPAIVHAVVASPDTRLPARHAIGAWESLARASGRRDVALLAAGDVTVDDLGVPGFIATRAETLADALGLHCHYFALLVSFLRFELTVERRVATLRCAYTLDRPPSHFAAEANVAVSARFLRDYGPPTMALRDVTFVHSLPDPGERALFEAFFGAPVRFGAAQDALSFDARWLSAGMRLRDAAVSRFLRGLADERLDALPSQSTLKARVREVVLRDPRAASAAHVAAQLAVSTRSLHRVLASEGVQFQDLVDGVRAEIARGLLRRSDQTIASIALVVGFSDTSAFHRAFRRWEGTSPSAYRRNAG